ncbi:MAG: DNA/RNA non-specific endonuclease [Muribaculaceae bacterium]|nr:DNA/RNA non-specific endonuclease [Muribaculaceae bacterium]
MRRFVSLLVALMVATAGVPTLVADGAGISTTFAAQAKSKKKNKKKTPHKAGKKNAKSSKKETKAAIVPLISTHTTTTSNKLLQLTLPRHMVNQTVNYKALTVHFNRILRIPNCVAYELTNTMVAMADAPTAERRKNYNFHADPAVAGCPDWGDYRRSGYTRGHMAPAMDMRGDKETMAQCFMMTNMCPQEQKLNNDHWRVIEEKIHRWAKRDGRLLVFTGPIMGRQPAHIGPNHDIAVPDAFYKIVYAPGQQRAIAFIYANKPCPGSWRNYATTIDEVERRTGIDFLTALPAATQNSLERMCNPADWE